MSKKIVVLLFSFIILLLSCNTTEPPQPEKTISLSLEDAASIEAWIKLTTTNLQLPTTLTLKQSAAGGDQTTSIINLDKADTSLYIDSLLPSSSYNFQATGHSGISSNQLQVTTLDTTSHNFTWQSWTFGEHSSSVLNDVAIIDENNIWAVGEIYLNDSLGQPDPHAYNAAHWDGTEWEITRIPFTGTCSAVIFPPIRSIFAFSEDDIWFARGGSLVHYDGVNYFNDCRMNSLLAGSINKIWGTSSDKLYVVGNNGTLIGYNGTLWWRIFSGTELHINDIWGEYNERNDEWEILTAAANRFVGFDKKILRINYTRNLVDSITTAGIPYSLQGIWFQPGSKCYVSGAGMYTNNNYYTSFSWEALHQGITNNYLDAIRGNDLNDVVVCGAFGEILHYNGASWKSYLNETYINGALGRLSLKDNVVSCVGLNGAQAIVFIGRR